MQEALLSLHHKNSTHASSPFPRARDITLIRKPDKRSRQPSENSELVSPSDRGSQKLLPLLTAVASAAQETNCPPSWCQRTQEISQVASCKAAAAASGTGRAPPPATAAGLGLAAASPRSPSPDKAQPRQAGKAELRSTQDGVEQKNAALFSQGKL
ncbi:uncharacterized protein LOC110317432 [Mus pahari]|uniref:uncharacterized protein LOC110317432 n=1 Tax=Mus pahari TaxID=10093 RepID=UPI000A3093B8|nr:uncharacterized protein LOC110317432 [Mus pahari]